MKSHNIINQIDRKNSACFNIAWRGGSLPPAGIRSRREALAVLSIVHNVKMGCGRRWGAGMAEWLCRRVRVPDAVSGVE